MVSLPSVKQTALIVHDMQNDALKPGGHYPNAGQAPGTAEFIANNAKLVEAARRRGMAIFFTGHQLRADAKDAPLGGRSERLDVLKDHSWGAEPIDDLAQFSGCIRRDVPDALMVGGSLSRMFARGFFGRKEAITSPWKDPRVRIALRKAINFDGILDFQSSRNEYRAVGIEIETVYGTHGNYDPVFYLDPKKGELGKDGENYFYDLAEAKRLVDAAGYSNGFELDYIWQESNSLNEIQQLMTDELNKSGFVKPIVTRLNQQQFYDLVTYATEHKGLSITSAPGNTEPDYALYNNYHSAGRATTPYATRELDDIIERQRREHDPQKRAEILKEFQRYAAKTFPQMPTRHLFGSFSFQWPWLHNTNQPGHLEWLDPNMPRRNG